MVILFRIFNEDKLDSTEVGFRMEWEQPFLPRTGELFSYGFMLKYLDPEEVYRETTDEYREKWKDDRIYYLKRKPVSVIEQECLCSWMDGYDFVADRVYWSYEEELGHFVIVHVEMKPM